MSTVPGRPKLRGADHLLLRGYTPLIGLAVGVLLVALLLPTVQAERVVSSGGGSYAAGAGGGPATGYAGATATGPAGATATGPAGSMGVGPAGAMGATGPAGGVGGTVTAGGHISGPPAGATACAGAQVPGDPYSPPCLQWSGGANNGGATSSGVTANTITITYRETSDPDPAATVQQFTGGRVKINESQADVERTFRVLADYFNTHFQFYGRKIQIKVFHGQGSVGTEVEGGGQDAAQADGVNAAEQQHAFADVFSLTQPYSEALAAHKVLALNNLYFSQQWYAQHSPYGWSFVPDCTKVAEATADFVTKYMAGKPAAYAGGNLKGQPRKIALVAPDNPVYQACAGDLLNRVGRSNIADVRSYSLDTGGLQPNAQNLVNVFSGEGVTSVILLTDPLTPFFMSANASQSSWTPEWVTAGTALVDTDFVGQLMNQQEWTHAFGVSYLAHQLPIRSSAVYRAYKEMAPNSEPAQLLGEILYYAMEMLAIGVQEAGPNLTPATFQQGMARYPGGAGEIGAWAFPLGRYTPEQDGRIVWWDPQAISPYNGQPGAYDDNGQRYSLGQYPPGSPPVYLKGGP
jgi:hypothetical protein